MTKIQELQDKIRVFFGQNIPPFVHVIVFELLVQDRRCIQVSDCEQYDIVVNDLSELQMLVQRKIPKIVDSSLLAKKLKKNHFLLDKRSKSGHCCYKFLPKQQHDNITLRVKPKYGRKRHYQLNFQTNKNQRQGQVLCISKAIPQLLQQIDQSYSHKSSVLLTVQDIFQTFYTLSGIPFQICQVSRNVNLEQVSYLDKPIDLINFDDDIKFSFDYARSRSVSVLACKQHDMSQIQHKQSSQNSLMLTKKQAQQFAQVFTKQSKQQPKQETKTLHEIITGRKTTNLRTTKLLTPEQQRHINESIKTINCVLKNIITIMDSLPSTFQHRKSLLTSKYKAIRRLMIVWLKRMTT